MAIRPKGKRNRFIVKLRDDKKMSWGEIAKRYVNSETGKPLARSTIIEIYWRQRAKDEGLDAIADQLSDSLYTKILTDEA